jgi:hypothetical protein
VAAQEGKGQAAHPQGGLVQDTMGRLEAMTDIYTAALNEGVVMQAAAAWLVAVDYGNNGGIYTAARLFINMPSLILSRSSCTQQLARRCL